MLTDLNLLGYEWKNTSGKFRKWGLPEIGYYPYAIDKLGGLRKAGFEINELKTFMVVNQSDLTVPASKFDRPEKLLFVVVRRINLFSKSYGRQHLWPTIGSTKGLNIKGENGWAVGVYEILQTEAIALQLLGLAGRMNAS